MTDQPPSKGERTRAALVSAAVRRFALDGFNRASVTDIAHDVGITQAAVYRYFPDKEALFLAAVDADGAGLIDLVRSTLFEQFDPSLSELLRRLRHKVVPALADHPLVARVLTGTEPVSTEHVLTLPHLTELRGQMMGLLRLGQRVGVVRSDLDVPAVALGIETIVLYEIAHLATLKGSDPDDERFAAIATVLDAALRPCP